MANVWQAYCHWRYVRARYDMERRSTWLGSKSAKIRAQIWFHVGSREKEKS